MKRSAYFKYLFMPGISVAPLSSIAADDQNLETVIVIGNVDTAESTGLVGSVDVLSQEELRYQHVDDTLELFNKVPGVYLSRYNQGVINSEIAIRGFKCRIL